MNRLKECKTGDKFRIKYLDGSSERIRHLQNLGFIPTSIINVVNTSEDNMIVQVFNSRIAINSEISDHVYGTIIKKAKNSTKKLYLFRRR